MSIDVKRYVCMKFLRIESIQLNDVNHMHAQTQTQTQTQTHTHKPKKLTLCCVHASVTSSNHYFCVKCFIDYRSTFRRSFIVFNDFLQNNRLFQLISLFFFLHACTGKYLHTKWIYTLCDKLSDLDRGNKLLHQLVYCCAQCLHFVVSRVTNFSELYIIIRIEVSFFIDKIQKLLKKNCEYFKTFWLLALPCHVILKIFLNF